MKAPTISPLLKINTTGPSQKELVRLMVQVISESKVHKHREASLKEINKVFNSLVSPSRADNRKVKK